MGDKIQLPDRFLLIETLLWDRGYPLMELHLDRLVDSGAVFCLSMQKAGCQSRA